MMEKKHLIVKVIAAALIRFLDLYVLSIYGAATVVEIPPLAEIGGHLPPLVWRRRNGEELILEGLVDCFADLGHTKDTRKMY